MPLRHSGLIALLFALFVAVSVRPASAGQTSGQVTGYYVCVASVSTDGGKTSTVYLSDVIPNTGFRPGPVAVAFRNSLGHVNTNLPAQCFERKTEADARQWLQQSAHPGVKLVLTGWKYTAAGAASVSAPPSPTTPATPAQDSKSDKPLYGTPAPTGPLQGYCFENAKQKLFITKTFLVGRPTEEGVLDEFRAFVSKTYGTPSYGSAQCATLRDANALENVRQNEINNARTTLRLQIVEFDWAPAPKAALPAQTPAPATPQPNALDAYNRALAAQRPASNTGGARAASAPPKPSPAAVPAPATTRTKPAAPAQSSPQAAPMYSYCYAYGTPAGHSGGSVKQHFYITQPFQVSGNAGLNHALESFLRGAHPGETISASCLEPGPLEKAQEGRQFAINLRRKQPASFDVVEVEWKR